MRSSNSGQDSLGQDRLTTTKLSHLRSQHNTMLATTVGYTQQVMYFISLLPTEGQKEGGFVSLHCPEVECTLFNQVFTFSVIKEGREQWSESGLE